MNQSAMIGGKPKWVLRTPYSMLTTTVRLLHRQGPQTIDAIAHYLVNDAPSANRPNARRTSGKSSATQVVVTMGHLGLCVRDRLNAQLTELGAGYAEHLGTPDEPRMFREILLRTDCFAWFWARVTSRTRNLGRSDVLEMSGALYPEYNPETRKTLTAVFLNYARAAHLLLEGPGGHRYAVANYHLPKTRLDEFEAGSEGGARSQDAGSSHPETTGLEGAVARDPLREASILLGRASADEQELRDELYQARLRHALNEAVESYRGKMERPFLLLACQMAAEAMEAGDARLIRWSTRLVNRLLDLELASGA